MPESPKAELKRKNMGNIGRTYKEGKRAKLQLEAELEEEKTSHFVQLDDGTYAEMVEGHEMVAPGHQVIKLGSCANSP